MPRLKRPQPHPELLGQQVLRHFVSARSWGHVTGASGHVRRRTALLLRVLPRGIPAAHEILHGRRRRQTVQSALEARERQAQRA